MLSPTHKGQIVKAWCAAHMAGISGRRVPTLLSVHRHSWPASMQEAMEDSGVTT